ncbi:MAG: ferredoxin [Clostridia bacterium]|nr:MAG: ferredoxin [Clostridia bacterium]
MAAKVKITIDGREIEASPGDRLLWAALDSGIYIPHLCGIREENHPPASCRLCFVEIAGMPNPVTSCTQPVTAGMVVYTRSSQVDRLVRRGFQLLLSAYHLRCGECPKNHTCEIRRIAKERGLKLRVKDLRPLDRDLPVDASAGDFVYDPNRCVLCGQCAWACRHRAGVGILGFVRRGMERRIATFGEAPILASGCTRCGECVKACPAGGLTFQKEASG